jgi:hypothetical protein
MPAVIAVAGCHSPSRLADGPGHVLLGVWGRLLKQRSLARLLCATRVATLARVDTSYKAAALLSVASLITCLARPRGRVFVPKCPKAETAPLLGRCCQATTGDTIVPCRQPGDWLINPPMASTALLRSKPDLYEVAHGVDSRLDTAARFDLLSARESILV